MTQVETLEAELSGARKSAAGQATEMAELSKRLSDSLARCAKLDDKVGMPALICPCLLFSTWCRALGMSVRPVSFRGSREEREALQMSRLTCVCTEGVSPALATRITCGVSVRVQDLAGPLMLEYRLASTRILPGFCQACADGCLTMSMCGRTGFRRGRAWL